MARPSKSLTWAFAARMTEAERKAVRGAVTEYAQSDITLSLNDALRVLIRRGARPLPRTLEGLAERIAEHPAECEWCPQTVCPEAKRMEHARRILQRPAPNPSPAPPPAAPAPAAEQPPVPRPAPVVDPMMPPWRRGFQE